MALSLHGIVNVQFLVGPSLNIAGFREVGCERLLVSRSLQRCATKAGPIVAHRGNY